jgi:RNA polymerase sigma-70 factor (ECF subfamily)
MVSAFRSGSRPVASDAFIRRLYAEHGSALFRFAIRLTGGDTQRAEDLVQETIVRAWRNAATLADRSPRPWMFAVMRNLAIDAHRARQSRPAEAGWEALDELAVGDNTDQALESCEVAQALASLSLEHRQVIVETYYRGRSMSEAATALGIPVGTVKSRAFYALKALKLALEERGITS